MGTRVDAQEWLFPIAGKPTHDKTGRMCSPGFPLAVDQEVIKQEKCSLLDVSS